MFDSIESRYVISTRKLKTSLTNYNLLSELAIKLTGDTNTLHDSIESNIQFYQPSIYNCPFKDERSSRWNKRSSLDKSLIKNTSKKLS